MSFEDEEADAQPIPKRAIIAQDSKPMIDESQL